MISRPAGLALVICLVIMAAALVEDRSPPPAVVVPCPVPQWDAEASSLEELEARAARARQMMERCGEAVYEAKRGK
jgi:hypothetical protein